MSNLFNKVRAYQVECKSDVQPQILLKNDTAAGSVGKQIVFEDSAGADNGSLVGNTNRIRLDHPTSVWLRGPNTKLKPTGGVKSELHFEQDVGGNYVGFTAPTTLTSDYIWTLPNTLGGAGQAMINDGLGNLSWGAAGGGGGSAISILMRKTVTATGLTGVSDVLNYQSVKHDVGWTGAGGTYNLATGTITVPTNGLYRVMAQVSGTESSTPLAKAFYQITCWIDVAGDGGLEHYKQSNLTNNDPTPTVANFDMSLSGDLNLTAGDVLKFRIFAQSGSQIDIAGAAANQLTTFGITRL